MRGSEERKRGQGQSLYGSQGGKAPRSWRHFLKIMHKYFIYWDFRQHLQHQKHFITFSGGKSPLPMPAGAPTHIEFRMRMVRRCRRPASMLRSKVARNDSRSLRVLCTVEHYIRVTLNYPCIRTADRKQIKRKFKCRFYCAEIINFNPTKFIYIDWLHN